MLKVIFVAVLFASSVALALPNNETGCGLSKVLPNINTNDNIVPYIVGGTDAQKGQYPWMISLLYMGVNHICGATIIDDRWLLTAAHCFSLSQQPSMYTARAGRLTVLDYETGAESYQIEKIIIHENYHKTLFTNDITLLKTKKPINFANPYINRVCLPPTHPYDVLNRDAKITGWGDLKNLTGRDMAKIMQHADTKIVANAMCSPYGPRYSNLKNICATTNTTSVCAGDSGGPLHVTNAEGAYVQVGVTSFVSANGCLSRYPNVFTRISAFLDWMNSTITANS